MKNFGIGISTSFLKLKKKPQHHTKMEPCNDIIILSIELNICLKITRNIKLSYQILKRKEKKSIDFGIHGLF